MAEMRVSFNWDEFYCEQNAKILEDFLNRKVVEFGEIVDAFFPHVMDCQKVITRQDIFDLFKNEFSAWIRQIILAVPEYFLYVLIPESIARLNFPSLSFLYVRTTMNPFPSIVGLSEDCYSGLQRNTKVNVDAVLSVLIAHNYIPVKCRRLSRLSSEQCGFNIDEDYYEEFDGLSNDEIIASSLNSTDVIPSLLNFQEMKEKKDKFKKVHDIFNALLTNKIGAYIKVNGKHVFSTSRHCNYISYYMESNCGNPYYAERYKLLERLSLEQVKEILVNQSLTLHSSHLFNVVQSTDIETKFYIERTLKSFNGKNKIELDDLVFLEEEVSLYSLVSNAQTKKNIEIDWVSEAIALANQIGLERWNRGEQQITARNVCEAVAIRLAKNRKCWGKKGARSSDNVRKIALTGWSFYPPVEEGIAAE